MKDTFQKDSLRSLADHMIKSKHEQKGKEDGEFTDETIMAVILDMFMTGNPFNIIGKGKGVGL